MANGGGAAPSPNVDRSYEYAWPGASPRIFDWGDKSWPGGRIQVSQNHLLPNSDFSFDFAHFILERMENPKVLANIPKKIPYKPRFLGRTSPRNFEPGGHVPRIPRWRHPCAWPKGTIHCIHVDMTLLRCSWVVSTLQRVITCAARGVNTE